MNQDIANLQSSGFDKIVLKHYTTGSERGTRAALVKDYNVFIGVSRCDTADMFNRRLGRQIALGRALYAWKVFAGIVPQRSSYEWRQKLQAPYYKLAYTVLAGPMDDLDQILTNEIFDGKGGNKSF